MDEKRYWNTEVLTKPMQGFVRRKMRPSSMKMVVAALITFFAIFAGIVFIDYLGSTTVLAVLACIFIVFSVYMMLHLDYVSDVMFTREYEKAILAGAAGTGVEFLIIVKKNHEVVYYNPSCRQYFSYNVTGDTGGLNQLMDSMDVHEDAQEQLFAAIVAGRKAHLPLLLTNLSGEEIRINLHLQPIKRPKGYFVLKATKYLPRGDEAKDKGVNIDIASVDVTASLEQVWDEMPIGVFKAKEDGTLLYVNHKLSSVLGYQPGELIEKKGVFRDIIYGNNLDAGSFNQRYDGVIAFKGKNDASQRMHLKQIIVEGDKKPEFFRFGFVYKMDEIRVARSDFQPLIKADVEDGEAGVVWNQFVENSPIAIALLGDDSDMIRYNHTFGRLLKKLGEEGKNLTAILDTEAKILFNTLVASQSRSYEDDRSSIDVHFAANPEMSASLFVTPIDNAQDEHVRAIVYLIDNTEKKSLEQKFVQSQKMQAVGQLAGGIAHDFNNLLTAMIGFCDLLLMRYSPGEQSFADVMQIKQNANRAANLVRQLLAFSRKQTLQPEVVDIAEILSEISNLIRRLIGENIALKMRHGRDLSSVKVDQGQLEQVIVNLCVNARDAMDGKGELEILTRHEVVNVEHPIPSNLVSSSEGEPIADGNYVVIEVRDTGMGMSAEVQSKIFEPFFTTKEVGKGTGLGLATVYGIIEQTGGQVFVSSVEGKGTSFFLYLKQHKETKKIAKPVVEVIEQVQDLTGKGTVLVVEDETPVRMFSCRALQNKGYEVLEAEDGDTGLLLAKEHGDAIDLIVTDVMMPGITGPEMIEEILKDHPNMKVVFMSGYGEDAFVTSYGAEREFFFLPKPFTLNQLAAKVKEVLGE